MKYRDTDIQTHRAEHTQLEPTKFFYIEDHETKQQPIMRRSSRRFSVAIIMLVVTLITSAIGFSLSFAPEVYAATDTVSTCHQATINSTINNAAAGDTINFNCSGIITLGATLDITKTLTLDGTGQSVTISGNGLPNGGLPNGWYGAATVKVSEGSGIIMFVNEQGGVTATGGDQSGTYGAAVSGASIVGLPVMANGAFGGYITGATIENITNTPVTASVQYYDLSGNTVGTAKSVTIGGNASYGLYQGGSDQALPSGFYGTAQITVTGGPSSSLLVTTNAQSDAFFYSYTEPTL
jgi:hypothetical protein